MFAKDKYLAKQQTCFNYFLSFEITFFNFEVFGLTLGYWTYLTLQIYKKKHVFLVKAIDCNVLIRNHGIKFKTVSIYPTQTTLNSKPNDCTEQVAAKNQFPTD